MDMLFVRGDGVILVRYCADISMGVYNHGSFRYLPHHELKEGSPNLANKITPPFPAFACTNLPRTKIIYADDGRALRHTTTYR